MRVELLLGGLLLAAVFVTAGVAKLLDLEGSRRAVADFGVPRRLASPLGTLLPAAELATAAVLAAGALNPEALRAGALSALVLISCFCAAIAVSVVRGRAPDCHCFGQLHSSPASKRTLIRNGALLTLAAFIAGGGDLVWAAAAAAAILATVGLVALLAQTEQLDEGLPPLTRAPDFELPSLGGVTVSLNALLERGRPLLLVFTAPDCAPCIALAPEIADWQGRYADALTIAVVEQGDGSKWKDGRNVLLQRDREVADAYRAYGTPSAVLVSEDGHIASDVAAGAQAIHALLARTLPGFEERAEPLSAPLARRELLGRAVVAWAGASGLLTAAAWASEIPIVLKCRYARCGDRCCPKKAKCRVRGGRKVCVCPDDRPACGNRCCPDTFVCRSVRRKRRRVRRCVCPEGYIVCAGRCVRPRTDPRHCGSCAHTCPPATSCVDGKCVGGDGSGTGPGGTGDCDCRRGQTCCEGECTDLNTSEKNCGKCGHACAQGKTCCGGHCRSLEEDPQNCGRCGKRCADNEVCSEGECRRRCRRGLTNCKGHCVDTKSDPNYCGRCGTKCSGPFDTGDCCAGKCCDINADTCCPGGCRNLALDNKNCGACGKVCPPNSFCRFGVCTSFRPARTKRLSRRHR